MAMDLNVTLVRKTHYSISVDEYSNRVNLMLSGYWDQVSEVKDYTEDVEYVVKQMTPGFSMLVDMTQYIGYVSEVFPLHVEMQKIAKEAGMSRAAEVYPLGTSPLKLFSEACAKESGAYIMGFQNKLAALRWLEVCTTSDHQHKE